jgi:ABC-type multidrug transport system fused ATPase/permease subunit
LLLGNKDASEKEIEEALHKANAHFVYNLENKLETFVGSTSIMNLSGG